MLPLPIPIPFASIEVASATAQSLPPGGQVIVLWHWLAFGAMVFVLLILDLFVFHRESHEPSLRESAGWTIFWCSLALAFNGLIWYWLGSKPGLQFLSGYIVEWSLSMDNVFVFAVIFRFFRVPLKYQYRVLFWGILGAIFMRLAFILAGAELIRRFHWVLPIFGVFLIYTALKLAAARETEVHPERNIILRTARRLFRITKGDYTVHGDHFFAHENGRLAMTPMFLVLLVVESTDVLFAVDSVPAIFAITRVPFIVFTSNIFAILGLRALYFLLAGFIDLFRYLSYGLSAVLGFVGVKMIAEYAVEFFQIERFLHGENYEVIPPWVSLLVIVGLLGISIAASVVAKRREDRQAASQTETSLPQSKP